MKVILIYQTDSNHSRQSMELTGIATTEKERNRLVRSFLKRHLWQGASQEKTDEALEQIRQTGQTQCLSACCDLEILTQTIQTNRILE